MKTLKTIAGLVVLGMALALGCEAVAQVVTPEYLIQWQPRDFKSDLFAEQRLYVQKVITSDGGCVGCQTGIGTIAWDFEALSNIAMGTPCGVSDIAVIPGALPDDGCTPSINLRSDGGTGLLSTAKLSCYATTGGAYAQLCVSLTDGGSYNLGDAGLTLRTFR